VAIEAYFERIGYTGPRAPNLDLLHALQLLHQTAIPFESLDPLLGLPVALDPPALEEKLVRRRRGGYCFEQNGLFFHVLTALGFDVTPLAARVRWMQPENAPRTPLSHMLLKVSLDGADFICDVGFGGQSPTAPLRLKSNEEQRTPHGSYLIRRRDPEFELEMQLPTGFSPMYRFTEEPQSTRDFEVFNWYTATHPASRFVNNLVAARVRQDGRVTLLNDEWTFQSTTGSRENRILAAPADVHEALVCDFGLVIAIEDIERVWLRLPRNMSKSN